MKPKALNEKEWSSLGISFEEWNNLEGVKKVQLLKLKDYSPPFATNYKISYPNDIYLYDMSKKFLLTDLDLKSIQNLTNTNKNEVGGTIEYTLDDIKISLKFSGSQNRINLNFDSNTHTLFHTHPSDNKIYDPPSILDIVSYMALIVKYVSDLITKLSKGIEIKEGLSVQNSMVFTKDEVYVIYLSAPLLQNITKKITNLYLKNRRNFIFSVEKLLEEMELYYSFILAPFSCNISSISKYQSILSTLGIILERFSYSEAEVYILL